jgi:hypothetical protein
LLNRNNAREILGWCGALGATTEYLQARSETFLDDTISYWRQIQRLRLAHAEWERGVENLGNITENNRDEVDSNVRAMIQGHRAFCHKEEAKLLAMTRIWEYRVEVAGLYVEYAGLARVAREVALGNGHAGFSQGGQNLQAREILEAILGIEFEVIRRRVWAEAIVRCFQLED